MKHTRRGPKIVPSASTNAINGIPESANRTESCGKCGRRWTGLAPCHCSGCHETFSSLTAFDKHRAGSHAHGTRHCLHPATCGLVQIQRQHWQGWALPGEKWHP